MAIDQTLSFPPPETGGSSFVDLDQANASSIEDGTYFITNTNWYKSLPYGFAFWDIHADVGDPATLTVWLPISPNNITVITNFATNIITTLYGIVEQHSEVRYYDINIQGTTGFAPRYVEGFSQGTAFNDSFSQGRSSTVAPKGLNLGGFLPEITNTIAAASNLISSIGNLGGAQVNTGINADKSGYVAFHNLYRSFLKYKNDAAQVDAQKQAAASQIDSFVGPPAPPKVRHVHPIQFLNYKDGIKYDCVPISFTMVRSADNPMLYNYSIKLRAFNLQSVNSAAPDANTLAELGLGGLDGTSLFASLTSVTQNAATLVSGLL